VEHVAEPRPDTKKLLFKDPALVREMDNFFLLAKKAAENPNSSGTASVLTALNVGSGVVTYPLAKLFYSPRGVRLLTRALSLPVGSKAASAAWQAEVATLVGRNSLVPVAGAAEEDGPAASPGGR
jgi:hypothetical protein